MALSPFRLPRLLSGVRLIDEQGRATIDLQRWWQDVVQAIETQESNQDQVIADIQALQAQQSAQLELILANQAGIAVAQATANNAQAAADAGPSATARSGYATDTLSISGTGWITGPTVNLTTVSAGNLTIPGTTITGGFLTAGESVQGQFRVVELVGSTTIFTGNFMVNSGGVAVDPTTTANVAAFTLAETSTGSVNYRMDARRSGGPVGGSADVDAYLFCRRS